MSCIVPQIFLATQLLGIFPHCEALIHVYKIQNQLNKKI